MSSIPRDRLHLIALIDSQFAKLWDLIEPLTKDEALFTVDDDFTIKDLIAIRVWWSAALVKWIKAGQKNKTMAIPAEGYTWRDTPALNREIAQESRTKSFPSLRKNLATNKDHVLALVSELTDNELEQLGVYDWTGKWPVMRWVSVSTSSQYAGAVRQIRKALKTKR